MAHWLLKTEPSDYSFADLQREGKTTWAGVKNALARRHLGDMRRGDLLLVYHTGDERAVVGMAKVSKDGAEPEVAAGKPLTRPVPLAEIKADARLKTWALVKIGRLSAVPTTAEQFAAVLEMSEKSPSGR